MASKRELIVQNIVTQIQSISSIKKVTREPKDILELSVASFPHVLVETANETRENSSFSAEVRKESELEILLNIVVHGNNRDQQRNNAIEAIEQQLDIDVTRGGHAFDSQLTEVTIRELNEAAPYGQAVILFTIKYFYTKGTP